MGIAYFLSFGNEAYVSDLIASGSDEVRIDGASSGAPEGSESGPVAVLCCGGGSMVGRVVRLMICYKSYMSGLPRIRSLVLDRELPGTKGRCPQTTLFRHLIIGRQRLLKRFAPTWWASSCPVLSLALESMSTISKVALGASLRHSTRGWQMSRHLLWPLWPRS